MKIQCSGYCTNNFQTEEYITYIHPTIAFHSLESIRVTKICPFHSNNYKISRKGILPYRKTHFVYHHEILTPGEQCTRERTKETRKKSRGIPIRIRNETSC